MQFGLEPKIIRDEAGKLLGVSLSADAYAEHECGIGPILRTFREEREFPSTVRTSYARWQYLKDRRTLKQRILDFFSKAPKLDGVPLPPMGVERLRITHVPQGEMGLRWVRTEMAAGFAFGASTRTPERWATFRDNDLVCAWGDSSFICLGHTDETKAVLKEIYEHFLQKDIIFKMGRSFLMSGGLNILIASRIPFETAKEWVSGELKIFFNEKAFADTGIEKELRAAGQSWIFLGKYTEIDGEWRAWLNPWKRECNNSGWYTIEQLRLWAKGEGPVVRQERRKNKKRKRRA